MSSYVLVAEEEFSNQCGHFDRHLFADFVFLCVDIPLCVLFVDGHFALDFGEDGFQVKLVREIVDLFAERLDEPCAVRFVSETDKYSVTPFPTGGYGSYAHVFNQLASA